MNEDARGPVLLLLARNAISRELGIPSSDQPRADWMQEPGASFVTLELHGRLRGCIGSLEAHRPLSDDVQHNAVAAAFQDPRFPPLSREELSQVAVEVSLLSPPEQMHFSSELDAIQQLHPGQDGVILQYGRHRATYLPQVWEQLPEPNEFIRHLKEKAGLPADFWSDDIHLSRYSVRKYAEGAKNG